MNSLVDFPRKNYLNLEYLWKAQKKCILVHSKVTFSDNDTANRLIQP
jgi:hypothetical protein